MAPKPLGEVPYPQARIISQADVNPVDPAWTRPRRLTSAGFEESLHRSADRLVRFAGADACQLARLARRPSADPVRDTRRREPLPAEPGRIEFDFDLFETGGADGVPMGRASAVEDCRRTREDGLAQLGRVRIATHYEEREHRPIVRVLG